MHSTWFFKTPVADGENMANTAAACTGMMSDQMYELRALVDGRSRTVGVARASVAELVEANLVCVRSVIRAALAEHEAEGLRGNMRLA